MTLDLRVIKKSGWQILNYSDKRKVVEAKDGTKSWSNKKDANKAKDILIAAVATKKVILSDRYKFKEEYLKFATNKLEIARDKTVRLSPASVQGYVSIIIFIYMIVFQIFILIKLMVKFWKNLLKRLKQLNTIALLVILFGTKLRILSIKLKHF